MAVGVVKKLRIKQGGKLFQLTEEQKMIRKTVRSLATDKISPLVAEADEKGRASEKIIRFLAKNDLFKLRLPEKYGGINAGATTRALVIEELSIIDAGTALYVFTTCCPIDFILDFGSEGQQEKFFSQWQGGDRIGSFALSEPDHGSDAANLTTNAVLDGNFYLINGTKAWVSSGGVADFFIVFVRTGPGERDKGISTLIMERDTPGLKVAPPENKLGFRTNETNQLIFEDARAPRENRLGEEGDGWNHLMQNGAAMRAWGASAMSLGIAQGAMNHAVSYAGERTAFHRPITEIQAVRFILADMAIQIEAARSLLYRTTGMLDNGERAIPLMTSATKCFVSDMAMKVTTDAVQIFGGYGICKDYPVEKMMRDAKCVQILDGSNQIQRVIVARHTIGRVPR